MSSSHERSVSVTMDVVLGVTIPGVALSVLFLIATVWLRCIPGSRSHLNRVSFRLLTYALCCLWGARFHQRKETRLVLAFGVNGNRMEKYYIIGSVFFCSACNITPLAYGKLGWYAETGTCWFRDPSPSRDLRWLLGTQSVWMILMSAMEVVSFLILVIFMMRHAATMQRLRADTLPHNTSSVASRTTTFQSSLPAHPIVQYRSMVLRIGLYPLFSCFLSVMACSLDVYTILHPEMTELNFRLRILDLMVWALRPLIYALLACTDPSFLRAIRSLYPNSSSLSSSISFHVKLPTSNLTSTSSQCTADTPHSSNKQGNPIEIVRAGVEAHSHGGHNPPITVEEEESSQEERDNVAVQI
ncbi:hypothetical protein K438DRAFT_1774601 [Mycena galopus ATCC 62051]|nr:hypothetical protein K438DRAFT_1774601 [Mycena galopus ATCC 62051]